MIVRLRREKESSRYFRAQKEFRGNLCVVNELEVKNVNKVFSICDKYKAVYLVKETRFECFITYLCHMCLGYNLSILVIFY